MIGIDKSKEPWEMTKDETRIAVMESRASLDIPAFSDAAKEALRGYKDPKTKPLVEKAWGDIFWGVESEHRRIISQALLENKAIPLTVLIDYPDLNAK